MGLDSLGMQAATESLPGQLAAAAAAAHEVDGLPSADGATAVVVLGMGGSGIGGDVAAAVAGPTASLPIIVSKHYEVPAYVGPSTIVVASSFSGNTEETVGAARVALERGARLVALTSGGELAELASSAGVPVLPVDPTIPMPRAGIGAVTAPLLVLLERLGIAEGLSVQIDDAVAQLRRRVSAPGTTALIDGLVRRIDRTFPLVYGGGALGEVVANRWKGQFNENPKVPAFSNRVPELMHNEIAGWAQHGDVTRQVLTLVLLRHDFEHPQVQRRFELIEEISEEVVARVLTVRAEGRTPLAQLMDLVVVGDLVTVAAALAEGVDPGPIPVLDDIKARLRA